MSVVSLGAKQEEEIPFLPPVPAFGTCPDAEVHCLCCCVVPPPCSLKCTCRVKHWNRPDTKTWQGAAYY